ncbi:MAG: DUF116 domain-containing protein [Syntrophobacterales bacterium]|nr:DUF116 domain-containing protein [Syntrophobacterales bacterium]
MQREKASDKRLFLALIVLTAFLVLSVLGLTYFVPTVGLSSFPDVVRWIFFGGVVFIGLVFTVILGFLAAVIALGRDIPIPYAKKLRSIAIKYFFPLFVTVGRLVGLPKERVQHAFVTINNELVISSCRNGKTPKRILLLMPHCLQYSECPVKVTYRAENCKRCGKCPIKRLLELAEEYGAVLSVATGGTIARRVVKETKPDLIIAVACERDLTSGIQDTVPLPVYGIFNSRPQGPCFNTQVDLEALEAVLKEINK